jgi:hypothetical protein
MLKAANFWTASMTMASSEMEKSILEYPLNSAASPAVMASPTVPEKARGADAALYRVTERAARGEIRDSMVEMNKIRLCVVETSAWVRATTTMTTTSVIAFAAE